MPQELLIPWPTPRPTTRCVVRLKSYIYVQLYKPLIHRMLACNEQIWFAYVLPHPEENGWSL